MDSEKVKALIEQMAKAEVEYGCGYYSYGPWRDAYDELLGLFGFDEKWEETEGERLRAEYRARWEAEAMARRNASPTAVQLAGIKSQEERQRQRLERKLNA